MRRKRDVTGGQTVRSVRRFVVVRLRVRIPHCRATHCSVVATTARRSGTIALQHDFSSGWPVGAAANASVDRLIAVPSQIALTLTASQRCAAHFLLLVTFESVQRVHRAPACLVRPFAVSFFGDWECSRRSSWLTYTVFWEAKRLHRRQLMTMKPKFYFILESIHNPHTTYRIASLAFLFEQKATLPLYSTAYFK